MKDSPETDALYDRIVGKTISGDYALLFYHARQLELQRNDALAELAEERAKARLMCPVKSMWEFVKVLPKGPDT